MTRTDTIKASSTVPASTPTIPTVQFRGRTLNIKNEILHCTPEKGHESACLWMDSSKNGYSPGMRYASKSWLKAYYTA